jgi:hypothetical protein
LIDSRSLSKDLPEHCKYARRQQRWHITARPYGSEGGEAPLRLRNNKVWAFLLTELMDTPAVLAY